MTQDSERSAATRAATRTEPTPRQKATVRAFVENHGKPVKAVIEPLGRAGSRVVLVGADGHVGDVIVSDDAAGKALVEADEDVQVADWDADTVNATNIGPAHRRRMGVSLTRR